MRLLASGRFLLIVALTVGVWAGARGRAARDGNFHKGDEPRYLMNGVFLYDAIRSGAWHPTEWLTFAEHLRAVPRSRLGTTRPWFR